MTSENPSPGPGAAVTLREVTRDNLEAILALKVGTAQEQFVASNAVSIAQAYFYREILWFRAIYADETPVGFVMVADDSEEQEYFLSRLMLDARFQRRGYGERAVQLVTEYIKTRPGAKELQVSCGTEDGGPGPFYERLGFAYTGDFHGSEPVLRLEL